MNELSKYEVVISSDEEADSMYDEVIKNVAAMAFLEDSRSQMINPARMRQFMYVYGVMKYMAADGGARVTYDLHKPFTSVGSISVEADTIEIENTELFKKCVGIASNIEVYPKTNGKIMMCLTFHGMTKTM